MTGEILEVTPSFKQFKRIHACGNIIIIVWIAIVSGIYDLSIEAVTGWLWILAGVVFIIFPFTPIYSRYIQQSLPIPSYQYILLAGNIILIPFFAWILSNYLTDPYVAYNESNKFSLITWLGATTLSVLSFVASLIAFFKARKQVPIP